MVKDWIRNKTRISVLTTLTQHSNGRSSQCNKEKKGKNIYIDWNGKHKTVCRGEECLHGNLQEICKLLEQIN